jgi:hypothetical protein
VENEPSSTVELEAMTVGNETVAAAWWLDCARLVLLDESTLEGLDELSAKRFLIRSCQKFGVLGLGAAPEELNGREECGWVVDADLAELV